MSRPRLKAAEFRTAKPPPKLADPYYQTAAHARWAELVVQRAGGRCEAIDDNTGLRCDRARPMDRMFADHVNERRDSGADLDPANGQCLCGRHHTLKTNAARAKRAGLPPRA